MSIDSIHTTYSCNVYQPENFTSISDNDGYSSKYYRHHCHHQSLFSIDFFFSIENFMSCHQELILPQSNITTNYNTIASWSPISTKLSHMNIPYHIHPTIISQIIRYARSIANQDSNSNPKIIPIFVTIEAKSEETAISEASMLSIDGYVANMVPASRKAIEELEKIRVEDELVMRKCVICLDDILSGMEAIRMPCLHHYHKDCIVSWLEKSNFCPLCRFRLPC